MGESHTVIVGGGIVGLCAAYFLARRGAPVTLLEQDDLTDSASTGNAGLISVGHGPIPAPGKTAKALAWMFDPNSPIHIRPRLELDLIRWFWNFRRACSKKHYQHCMKVLGRHGWTAGECVAQLVDDEQLDCGYQPVGQMEVFRTEAGLAEGIAEAEIIAAEGYRYEVLQGDELHRREPAFNDDVIGAILYTDRAFASPGTFIAEMVDRARKRGAILRDHAPVADLIVEGGRCTGVQMADGQRLAADHVILAAGVWSTPLARRVGISIPMQPAKGYHLNLTRPEPCLNTACVLMERFVAVTPMDGGLRLAGTLELSGINRILRPNRLQMLTRGARLYLRGIDETEAREEWCGMRPCTADGLPVIGWAPGVRNLFIATGHAMMGFTLGPLAGRIACECILGDEPSADLSDLSPQRFA